MTNNNTPPSPPSERSNLLPPPAWQVDALEDGADGQQHLSNRAASRQIRRQSLFEALRIESHEGAEVSEVELFSDLAVVVAIHVVSDILAEDAEEEEVGGGDDMDRDGHGHEGGGAILQQWSWFFLRIAFLYVLWFHCMYLANLSSLYTSNAMAVRHYGSIFGVMVIIVLLLKACQNDDNRTAVTIFLGGYFSITALFTAEATFTPRPAWITPERYKNIMLVTHWLMGSFLLYCLPLAVVLIFFHKDDGDDVYLLWAGAWMVVARVIFKAYMGWTMDRTVGYHQSHDKLFDKEHLHERYSLVMLIFLGELCFASATEAGEYYISLCALLTGMGCFLNYFVARVPGRTEAWVRSAWSSIWCQHLHLFLFWTVPAMGVAFVWIIRDRARVATSVEEPSAILSIAAGAFLVLMAGLEALTSDPNPNGMSDQKGTPRLQLATRALLNFATGIALMVLSPFIIGDAVPFFVPAVMMSIGILQVWGSRVVEKGIAAGLATS